MNNLFYKLGQNAALRLLHMVRSDGNDSKGTPFPAKSPTIGAEAFAQRLQEDDDERDLVHPENGKRDDRLNRPVTWGSSSFVDENQPTMGLMLPGSPRG